MALQIRSAPKQSSARSLPGIARLAVVLEVFLGLGALFGGGALILAPDGHLLGMPVKLLAGSPFPSFLVPGIILFGLIGVAPLMAALVALLNQAKQKNVGFLNPFLYANVGKGVTRDVTAGTNAIKSTVKGYNAGAGWDACTGLGTPDGTTILNNL